MDEMVERDWRIFKEDYNIVTKGGRIPPPLRNWPEANLPSEIMDLILKIGYQVIAFGVTAVFSRIPLNPKCICPRCTPVPVTPCGLRGYKNRPAPFPGWMSYKATKPGLVSVLYLSKHYTVLLFIRARFYVSLVFVAMCSVFSLFWLSCHYLPSDWLERLL